MKILHFAFGSYGNQDFLPHNYIKNCVVYTGSHDNDTTRGFFEREKNLNSDLFRHAQQYMNYFGDNMTLELVRLAYQSPANILIIPMQDILNLDNDSRMNFPGKPDGNWEWRFTWNQVPWDLSGFYKYITDLYERNPKDESKNKNGINENSNS